MGGEILLMMVVAFACAAIGYGAIHFAAKLAAPGSAANRSGGE
jgi:hypothetical protein